MDRYQKELQKLLLQHAKRRRRLIALLLVLSLMTGGLTYAAFHVKGRALTKEAELNCTWSAPVGEGYADYAVHVHTEDCYDAEGNLVCPLPEIYEHVHTDACYRIETTSVCGLEEAEGHTHAEECFDENGELVCGMEETEGHIHTEECYETVTELICGQQGVHYHTPDCYDAEGELVCGLLQLEEHAHGPECFTDAPANAATENTTTDTPADGDAAAETATGETDGETPPESGDEAGEDGHSDPTAEPEAELVLEKVFTTAGGEVCHVIVTCPVGSGIPGDAVLDVSEILQETEAVDGATEYEDYVARTEEALGCGDGEIQNARFFDIRILDAAGNELQPAGDAPVRVEIRFDGQPESEDTQVVHFGDEATEVLDAATEEDTVTFETTGFSVYAIVDAPPPAPNSGWSRVASLDELASLGSKGFYVRNPSGYYFTNQTYNVNSTRTGILKTAASSSAEGATGAALYYFLLVQNTTDQFRIYCLGNNNERLYVRQSTNSLSLVSEAEATVFTVSPFPNHAETFRILGSGGYYWNMQGGNNGKGFAAFDNATDTNARIQLEYYTHVDDDPYGLNGATYGIAWRNETVSSAALMSDAVSGGTRLAGVSTLMRPDVLDHEGILLVSENSDITQWTFRAIGEDLYHITTPVDGQTRYLTIRSGVVSLEAEPDPVYSAIRAIPGSGEYATKWRFTVAGYSLNLPGSASDGFNATTGTGARTWMNLVERSVLNDDDFNLYTARKVSVSDTEELQDGQQVVLYTRIWNDTTKRYEFYAVDHNGSLVRCYDTGDNVEWIGSRVNTALWRFTEHTGLDGKPNWYYDLQNVQYGNFIAPQITGAQILSDGPLGINLNGRRYGENYTTVVAWDDANYSYVGLKAENGRIVACPLSEAQDFYFAVVVPAEGEEGLTEVTTMDSAQFGITMRMVDFNNAIVEDRDSLQTEFFGRDSNTEGLLSTNLDPVTGYPTTGSAAPGTRSLGELFTGMNDVNYLFLQSIYNESGYFEFDSTQNFAHLNEDGTFTVYDQLAAIAGSSGPTRTHGQFMPYNVIHPGLVLPYTNQTNVSAQTLPDTDPRKGETLYMIPKNEADYFFGMEMEASFTQTANGLDAWGHDIIFEFSGDDDFWLYVDGELVLDLGGVHPAMTGSVNFRTGVVISSRGESTLYEIFRKNYTERGLSDSEIASRLEEIFVENAEGNWVFRDYTNHDMKIFYMERGAGASNLHMRFNLAAVKPGTFLLSKKLTGTEASSNSLIQFPYQVYYYTRADGESMPHLLGANPGEAERVFYEGTSAPVRWAETFTPAGGAAPYESVFFLKPGETASVELPSGATRYYVVECGVNPDVYDTVTANGDTLTGTVTENLSGSTARMDYATSEDTLANRSRLDFENHVREGAMRTLTITKVLYDANGVDLLHYPDTAALFSFRLYLGDENTDVSNVPAAYLYPYCVRDPEGNYCRWDAATQRFASLGKTEYGDLTESERESATFTTSMYGSISKIPADYTVEIRDLIVGTRYQVEERDIEIPKGYTLRLEDGYTRVDGEEVKYGTTPVSGILEAGEDPAIQVRNQKGWGLTVEKVWTDSDFMTSHDPIFFAVYVRTVNVLTEQTGYVLVDGSVRQLMPGESSVYWFFGNLQSGTPFADYVIFEVEVAGDGTRVDSLGRVTGFDSLTPIPNGGTLTVGGTPVGGSHMSGYDYEVRYETGEQTNQNENVRVDTVTNSRPGIELRKTDLEGAPLAGATFTLRNENGQNVSAVTYTSDSNGLITIAYLPAGTYTLTEIRAPKGYVAIDRPVTLTVAEDGTVTASGPIGGLCTVDTDNPDMIATVTVRNRPSALLVRKVDAVTGAALPETHFALYRQVSDLDGNLVRDYLPMTGYENIVSDENGILTEITMELGTGAYYLVETATAPGYIPMEEELCFSLGGDGTVTILTDGLQDWLSALTDPQTNSVSYVLEIPNENLHHIVLEKVDMDTEAPLEGAAFALYDEASFDDGTGTPLSGAEPIVQGVTDENGLLTLGDLRTGSYRLVETQAPDGYVLPAVPVLLTVEDENVTAILGSRTCEVVQGAAAGTWQVCVWNGRGVELPRSGGSGTLWFTLAGGALFTGAAIVLLLTKRRPDGTECSD